MTKQLLKLQFTPTLEYLQRLKELIDELPKYPDGNQWIEENSQLNYLKGYISGLFYDRN